VPRLGKIQMLCWSKLKAARADPNGWRLETNLEEETAECGLLKEASFGHQAER